MTTPRDALWPGVIDPERPPLDQSQPARAHRLKVRLSVMLVVVGLAVALVLWARWPADGRLEGYRRSADPDVVVVRVLTGSGDVVLGGTARETAGLVSVTVPVRSPWGARTLEGYQVDRTIELEQPLGSRTVVDARTGAPLSELE